MVIKEPEVAMINAAAEALNYISRKPSSDVDEIIKHVIKVVDARGEVKIAAIAAANKAIASSNATVFSITSSGTVKGAFLTSNPNKSNAGAGPTTGTL